MDSWTHGLKEGLIEHINSTLDTIVHEMRSPMTRFRITSELAMAEKDIPGKLEELFLRGWTALKEFLP